MRAWFQVARDGALVANIPTSSFITVLINSSDSSYLSCSVTQSLQKLGLYYFDVPSSFLLASGTGDYGISVELNTNTPVVVTDTFSAMLRVTREDFDSLSGSIWNTSANSFNTSGTMGHLQNVIASGSSVALLSSSINTLVNAIWDEPNNEHTISGSVGSSLLSGSNPTISASVNVDASAIADAVWDENISQHNTSGTTGWMVNKLFIMSQSIDLIRGMTEGQWHIVNNQMVFYDRDNSTEIARFNLFDSDGNQFFAEENSPARRQRV